jgi:hypothetical protein
MPVFISHQQSDAAAATRSAEYLRAQSIPVYVDVLDPILQSAPENVTDLILSRLRSCTHLLAVISAATERSWWVPFEIGVATQADGRITSLLSGARLLQDLPDYLRMWPVLRSLNDLPQFVRSYRADSEPVAKRFTEASSHSAAAEFHRSLKSSLGQ